MSLLMPTCQQPLRRISVQGVTFDACGRQTGRACPGCRETVCSLCMEGHIVSWFPNVIDDDRHADDVEAEERGARAEHEGLIRAAERAQAIAAGDVALADDQDDDQDDEHGEGLRPDYLQDCDGSRA